MTALRGTSSTGLEGRRVIVTGAGGGLGRACCAALVAEAATPVLCDSDAESLVTLAAELEHAGGKVETHVADLRGVEAGVSAIETIVDTWGRVDGLVNCVGITRTTPFADVSAEEWRAVLQIDLDGVFGATQAAGRHMVGVGGGVIVSLSSVAGRSGRAANPHYAAAKAAVISLTRSAALAFAPTVRVNAVCPGVIMTPMWEAILADRTARFGHEAAAAYLRELTERTPLDRVGTPAEIADAIVYLLGDRSSFITGQALNVDGGLEMD